MNSLPKVIATIEDEISALDSIISTVSQETSAHVASEQAGLKKLLAFAKEITGIQTKFEQKLP